MHASNTTMMARLLLPLVLIISGWAVACLGSCNTVYLNKQALKACGYGGPVSVGSFSEVNEFESNIISGPPGANLPLLEVEDGVPSPLGKSVQIFYGFVCIGHNMSKEIVANFPGLPVGTLVCNQGMNQRSLAVGLQAQDPALARLLAYDPNNKAMPGALNWWDLTKFVLSRYENVQQVRKAFTQDIQLVYPTGSAWKGGRGPAQWMGVYDAEGNAAVIQSRNGTIEVVDNPLGALANNAEPGSVPKFDLLQEQYAKWRAWTKDNGYELDAEGNFIVGPVDTKTPGISLVRMSNMPSNYDGDMRFMRLAFLSSAARLGSNVPGLFSCWPNPKENPTSPAANPNYLKYPANNPTIMAALAMINTVALPLAAWPPGCIDDHSFGALTMQTTIRPMSEQYYASYWYTIRDHENKLFFYRTMNSHVWRMVNLTNPAAFNRLNGQIKNIRLTSPRQSGYYDVTNDYLKWINI